MNENSPYRQGTDPMEVIDRRIEDTNSRVAETNRSVEETNRMIDEARFVGNEEELGLQKAKLEEHQAELEMHQAKIEEHQTTAAEWSNYLQERPLRKVEKGDQLYDQTQGHSLEELSRDELVSKWAEAEDAGDATQSSDVQDEIERRLDSEKNMSDDLKMRMIDRLYSKKEELRKNKDSVDKDDEQDDSFLTELPEKSSEKNDQDSIITELHSIITEQPQTPPDFTGEAPEYLGFESDSSDELPVTEDRKSESLRPFVPMIQAESDINEGRARPIGHPEIVRPENTVFDYDAPFIESASSEEQEVSEVVDDRSFMDKVKDAKARVFATVTSSWMKTKDFFKETDQEGNEKVNKKRVGVAAGAGVLVVAAAGYVFYRYGIDKPRGGGNAMDTMDSGPRPKVGPNGTEGAIQINEPSNPGVVSVPKGGSVEMAMPAPKPSVNLDQAPWNVAHELAPGDEMIKINETIEKFNNLTGSQLSLNKVGDTVQIYNGNRAITPAQQQFFNEMMSQNL